MEANSGAIDADNSSRHGYHIIIFSSFPYTLRADFIIYSQVISPSEMVCEGDFFSNKYQSSLLCFSKIYQITLLYL